MGECTLTLGSLFDGSGGFPLAGILAGVKPCWSSEIEPFPVLVTQKRLPDVKHYGDVSKLSGYELEPVDIITFGSPCQDLSVAGKRAGIQEGQRSNLFFEAVRIIKEMREETDGRYPEYIVWENVPGAFSSNGGDDFRAVLEAVVSIKEKGIEVPAPENGRWPKADILMGDGWSVAYRVLDAQYWGVPQRRARIFLVADLNGQGAGEILFKSEGLSGYSAEGFRTWQRTAGSAEEGAGEAGRGTAGRGEAEEGKQYVLNTQGRSGVSVTRDKTDTIIAHDHGNHPSVLQAAGFSTEHSAKARSIGYEEEKSPTLRAGVVPAAMLFDNHPQEARYDGPLGESPTVTARYGTGGNNQPLVAQAETPKTLKIRSGKPGGGKGALIQDDKSATLGTHNDQTLFQPAGKKTPRAYGVCSKSSHSMLSDNPHSGFYEAKTSRTLDQSGGNPACNQGGIAVVSPDPDYVAFTQNQRDEVRDLGEKSGSLAAEPGMKQQTFVLQGSMIGRKDKNGPRGDGINEDVSFTLNTADRHAVAAPEKRVYTASKASFFTHAHEKVADTLVATDYKDPPLINDTPNGEPLYIVRRLTPTECARLQGFPDWWCRNLEIKDPSEGQISFWMDVWNAWNSINGKKPKTEKQVRKWLASPHTDGAEYKLWGNGVALPCVYFVLSGIVWAAGKEGAE